MRAFFHDYLPLWALIAAIISGWLLGKAERAILDAQPRHITIECWSLLLDPLEVWCWPWSMIYLPAAAVLIVSAGYFLTFLIMWALVNF